MLLQYLSAFGVEATFLSFVGFFSYLYLSLIWEIEEKFQREIPRLHHDGFWWTRGEAEEMKRRVNRDFWPHVRTKIGLTE